MLITKSVHNVPIRLTEERWKHIRKRHPELKSYKDAVLDTVNRPDLVQKGDHGAMLTVRFYQITPLSEKHLVVAYKEESKSDGFVITAWLASELAKWRETIWQKEEETKR